MTCDECGKAGDAVVELSTGLRVHPSCWPVLTVTAIYSAARRCGWYTRNPHRRSW